MIFQIKLALQVRLCKGHCSTNAVSHHVWKWLSQIQPSKSWDTVQGPGLLRWIFNRPYIAKILAPRNPPLHVHLEIMTVFGKV